MAKMMGNDIVTQEEFDTFVITKLTPMQKEMSDIRNQIKALFGGTLICLIIAVTLFVKFI